MNELLQNPIFWVVLTAISEIIGMNKKCKQNSILEVVINAVLKLKPKSLS